MQFGFPSGKLDKLTLMKAVDRATSVSPQAIEVTALRYFECDNIMREMQRLILPDDCELSFHAPAAFTDWQEMYIAYNLRNSPFDRIPVVLHPDTIKDYSNWEPLHSRLRIENMDLRKHNGITVESLRETFEKLPDAEWCFDVGHARQVDPTMDLAKALLDAFGERLGEIHMSVVLPCGKHSSMTEEAAEDYHKLFDGFRVRCPVILETLLEPALMANDLELARTVFGKAREATPSAAGETCSN